MPAFCQDCCAGIHIPVLVTHTRETRKRWRRGSSLSVYPVLQYVLQSLTWYIDFVRMILSTLSFSKFPPY